MQIVAMMNSTDVTLSDQLTPATANLSDLATPISDNMSDQVPYDSSWVPVAQFAMEGVTQGIVGIVGLVGEWFSEDNNVSALGSHILLLSIVNNEHSAMILARRSVDKNVTFSIFSRIFMHPYNARKLFHLPNTFFLP